MEVMCYIHGLHRQRDDVDTGDLRRDLTTVLTRRHPEEFDELHQRIVPALIAYSATHNEFGKAWRNRVMEPPRAAIGKILRRAIGRGLLPRSLNIEHSTALSARPRPLHPHLPRRIAPDQRRHRPRRRGGILPGVRDQKARRRKAIKAEAPSKGIAHLTRRMFTHFSILSEAVIDFPVQRWNLTIDSPASSWMHARHFFCRTCCVPFTAQEAPIPIQSPVRHCTQFRANNSGALSGLNRLFSLPQSQRSHERRITSLRMNETRVLGLITLMVAVALVGCTPTQTKSTIPTAGLAPATGNSDACLYQTPDQIPKVIDSDMKQVDSMRTTAATCSPRRPLGEPAQPCVGDACAAFALNFYRQSAKPDFNRWIANTVVLLTVAHFRHRPHLKTISTLQRSRATPLPPPRLISIRFSRPARAVLRHAPGQNPYCTHRSVNARQELRSAFRPLYNPALWLACGLSCTSGSRAARRAFNSRRQATSPRITVGNRLGRLLPKFACWSTCFGEGMPWAPEVNATLDSRP